MRNKVLVITSDITDFTQFEMALQEMLKDGGELFLAQNKKEGQLILKKEHPQLLFLDTNLWDATWQFGNTHLVLLCLAGQKKEGKETLFKPLKQDEIQAVAHTVLKKESVPPERPM